MPSKRGDWGTREWTTPAIPYPIHSPRPREAVGQRCHDSHGSPRSTGNDGEEDLEGDTGASRGGEASLLMEGPKKEMHTTQRKPPPAKPSSLQG